MQLASINHTSVGMFSYMSQLVIYLKDLTWSLHRQKVKLSKCLGVVINSYLRWKWYGQNQSNWAGSTCPALCMHALCHVSIMISTSIALILVPLPLSLVMCWFTLGYSRNVWCYMYSVLTVTTVSCCYIPHDDNAVSTLCLCVVGSGLQNHIST